jgi:hypothetical protein
MVGCGAGARTAILRADTVAVLRNLDCGPMKFRKRGNQSGNYTGFAHAA